MFQTFVNIGKAIYQTYKTYQTAINTALFIAQGVTSHKAAMKAKATGADILLQKYGTGKGIPVIYGTRRVAGTVVYMETQNNRELYVVYAIAAHEVDSFDLESIQLDGRTVKDTKIYRQGYDISDGTTRINFRPSSVTRASGTFWGNTPAERTNITDAANINDNARMTFNCHKGTTTQAADPMLEGILTDWTSNHKLTGIAYIAANYEYDTQGMFTGIPNLTVVVNGKKVFDPRDTGQTFGTESTYTHSSNAALCLLDYITNDEYGKGLGTSDLESDFASWKTAANDCDTSVDTIDHTGISVESASTESDVMIIADASQAKFNKLKVGNKYTVDDGTTTYVNNKKLIDKDSTQIDLDGTNPFAILKLKFEDGAIDNAITSTTSCDFEETQIRFDCNGVIDTDETVLENTKLLIANMRGIFTYANGKYQIKVEGAESSVVTLDEDDILESGITLSLENKEGKYNRVEAEFYNAQKRYETDTTYYTGETLDTFLSDDGNEVLETRLQLPFCTNQRIAYNHAKALLKRSRKQKTISFVATPKVLKAKVGEVITVSNTNLNLSSELYRITDMVINPDLNISVTAIEYQTDVYGYVTPPDEDIDIPNDPPEGNRVIAPTNLTFTNKNASTGEAAKLTWTDSTKYPSYEFRVRIIDGLKTRYDKRVKDTYFYLDGISVKNGYVAKVSAINSLGVESDSTDITVNVTTEPVTTPDIKQGSIGGFSFTDSKMYHPVDGSDTGIFETSNVYIDNAGQFSLKDKLSFDGTTLDISGNITADSLNVTGATVTGTLDASTITLNGEAITDILANPTTGTQGEVDIFKHTYKMQTYQNYESGSDHLPQFVLYTRRKTGSTLDTGTKSGSLLFTTNLRDTTSGNLSAEEDVGGIFMDMNSRIAGFGFGSTDPSAKMQFKLVLPPAVSSDPYTLSNILTLDFDNGSDIRSGLDIDPYRSGFTLKFDGTEVADVLGRFKNFQIANHVPTTTTNRLYNNAGTLSWSGNEFLDSSGNATFTNLTVNGTTTTLNTATLDVEDKNITLNYGAGDTSSSADGAGITIQDAVNSTTDATILWDATNDEFDFSHDINVTGTVSATSFSGDGSGLTGITSTTINNNADNRVITGSGTANTLNGEANMTFDGSVLDFGSSNATVSGVGVLGIGVGVTTGSVITVNGTEVMNVGRNLSNIGTISSGQITSTSSVVATQLKSTSQVGQIWEAPAIHGSNTAKHEMRSRWDGDNDRWFLVPYPQGSADFTKEIIYNFGTSQWAIEGTPSVLASGLHGTPDITVGTISSGHLTVNTSTLKTTNDAIGLFTTDLTVGNNVAQQSTATPKRIFFNNDYSSGYTDASLKIYLFNDSTTRAGFTSGPAFDMQYHMSGSSSGRHAFYIQNVEKARIDNGGIDIKSGGLDINGTEVINSSANLTNIGSISANDLTTENNATITSITGSRDLVTVGSGSRGGAIKINDIAGANYFIAGGNYDLTFYKNVSGTSNVSVMKFVGANASDNTPDVSITNNLTVGGTISSKTILMSSATGTYQAGSLGYTDSNWGFLHRPPQAGAQGAHLFEAYDGTDLLKIEEDGDATFSGTISSGGITATDTYGGGSGDFTNVTTPQLKIVAEGGTYWRIPHLSGNSTISGIYNYQSGKDVYWGEPSDTGLYRFRGRGLRIENGGLDIGSTEVIDSSRNLTNIASLAIDYAGTPNSSNLHVSGGKITIASTSNGYGQIQVGNTSTGEASVGYFSGVTESSIGGTGSSMATYQWATGLNVYGIGANTWGIGNKTNSDVFRLDVAGNLSVDGGLITGGNIAISGGGLTFRLTDTNITNSSHNTFVAYASAQNKFSLGVSSTTGLSNDITINGANNGVTFAGAISVGGTISSSNIINGLAYQISGTQVISSARNIENVGTINSGAITSSGIISTNHVKDNGSSSGLRLGNFSTSNADETGSSVVTFLRSSGFDDFIIKGSTSRGVFGRQFIGTHFSSNHSWGVFSSGWDTHFQISGDDKIYMKPNVGIGTNNPLAPLHVDGNVYVDTGHTLFSDIVRPYSTFTMQLGGSGSDIAYFTGKIGVGTNNPSGTLDVVGGGSSTAPTLELNTATSTTFNHAINAFNSNLTAGENNIIVFGQAGSTKNSGYIGYKWNGAGGNNNLVTIGHWGNDNLVNITGDGKVGIGTQNPTTTLQIVGNVDTGNVFLAGSDSGNYNEGIRLRNASNNHAVIAFGASGTAGTPTWSFLKMPDSSFQIRRSSTVMMTLANSTSDANMIVRGNITAYGSPSDIRLKENIATIENPLDKVAQLRGITFDYKKDGKRSTGLIAQELEKVLPEAVYETNDIDDKENKFKAVRYGNVVGLLVEAIKELKAEIEELKKA